MVRRATWKPRREDARRTWGAWALRVGGLGFVAAVGLALLGGLAFNYLLVLLGFALALVGFAPPPARLSARHSGLLAQIAPAPPPPGTFPARVTYYRGIDPTSEDEAIVSFGDGWLTVEGIRASFSVRPTDAHVLYTEGNGFEIVRRDDERIVIQPYDALRVGGESHPTLRNRFETALNRWAEGVDPEDATVAVLPPIGPLGLPSEARTLVVATSGAVLSTMGVHLLLDTVVQHRLDPVYALVCGAGLGLLTVAAQRQRRWTLYRRSLPPTLR